MICTLGQYSNIHFEYIHFEYANYLIDVHVTNMSLVKRSHFLGYALFNMYQKDMENKNMTLKIKLVNLLQSYFNIRIDQLFVKSIAIDISIFWKSYRIRVVWTICFDGYPYPRMFQLSRT
jgi:hypothetical protein